MSVPIDCYPQKWVLSRSPLDRLGIFKRVSRKRGELMLAIVQLPSGFCISGATKGRLPRGWWWVVPGTRGGLKTATRPLHFHVAATRLLLIVVTLKSLRGYDG